MKSVDELLDRVPRAGYNCMDFIKEAWLFLMNEDIHEKLNSLEGEFKNRHATLSERKWFRQLKHPVNPCFVMFQRKRTIPHVGIYIDGNVLHLADHGAEFTNLSLAKRYFTKMKFYR